MPQEVRPLVFLGTPDTAATVLTSLIDAGFHIIHVVTRPDAKRGRGSRMTPSPVKEVALRHNIAVSHDLNWVELNSHQNLLGIVVAYGRIIPGALLEKVPMINIHFSLLPRWRGAAPVERAIMAGDSETGVCIMDVEATLDSGAIYATATVPIDDEITATALTRQLAQAGAELLVTTLQNGLGTPVAQQSGGTYAAKITPDDLRIDWTNSAVNIHRQVRALRAYTVVYGNRLRILATAVES
ncbi:MAG: methionyl-tRNA formyltransferase, partial [Actinobacteria bacterium]|nr:methionyl-tRNA formyltransferase [Actinomycetota bacterium]